MLAHRRLQRLLQHLAAVESSSLSAAASTSALPCSLATVSPAAVMFCSRLQHHERSLSKQPLPTLEDVRSRRSARTL
jgi:hypothetical protein